MAFHSLGVEFLGVVAASAFLQFKDSGEEGENEAESLHRLSDDIFQFAYNDEEQSLTRRCEAWLNEVILTGLDQWRRQL